MGSFSFCSFTLAPLTVVSHTLPHPSPSTHKSIRAKSRQSRVSSAAAAAKMLSCGYATMRQPEVLWAQRSDKIYLTIALPDAKDVVIKCEPQGVFNFSATRAGVESFKFDLELYGAILPDGCKTSIGLRNITCSIQKENKGWWKRLLKSEGKPAPFIKVDWHKWCDEDDEDSNSDFRDSDDDYALENGEDDDSADDDGLLYLPDLEKAIRK